MTIFYDHQIFSLQNFGGASRLFAELIYNINHDHKALAHLSILYHNNAHLGEKNLATSAFDKIPLPSKKGIVRQLNHFYNVLDISYRSFDIYHPTYYDCTYLKHSRGKPTVITFLDMIHEKFGQIFPEIRADLGVVAQKREMAKSSTHIIAISESTKKDIVELYDIDPSKITVIHLGSAFGNVKKAEDRVDDSRPFLLYVGNRDAYKNFQPMLKAIAKILVRENISLICAGGKAFTPEEISLIDSLKVRHLVRHEIIDDKKLASLYARAVAFIFPSLYEGFGIPILEAFSCNCPCIVSNTSSLPEVGGEAVLYIDPADERSITGAVDKILSDTDLRNSLIKKGRERLKHFSWEKMTQQTLNVYNKL